jgi:hypothetical protein
VKGTCNFAHRLNRRVWTVGQAGGGRSGKLGDAVGTDDVAEVDETGRRRSSAAVAGAEDVPVADVGVDDLRRQLRPQRLQDPLRARHYLPRLRRAPDVDELRRQRGHDLRRTLQVPLQEPVGSAMLEARQRERGLGRERADRSQHRRREVTKALERLSLDVGEQPRVVVARLDHGSAVQRGDGSGNSEDDTACQPVHGRVLQLELLLREDPVRNLEDVAARRRVDAEVPLLVAREIRHGALHAEQLGGDLAGTR